MAICARRPQCQGQLQYHHEKRSQEPVGAIPREALEAWRTRLATLTGLIEPDNEPEESKQSLTVDQAIDNYLVEVAATKGGNTYPAVPSRVAVVP
jgi:hypothetical protein